MRSRLSVVGLRSTATGILSTKSFPASVFYGVLSVFASRSFSALGFKLRSLHRLWLVSVQGDGDRIDFMHVWFLAGHSSVQL